MEKNNVDIMAAEGFAFANRSRGSKNLAELTFTTKLRKIDKNLSATKQNVVKHVLKARALEKEKIQAIAIHESLKGHFDSIMRTGRFASQVQNIINGLIRLNISANDLKNIEIASGITDVGMGNTIQRYIEEYMDTSLENTLSLIQFEELTSSLFCRIAIASSNGAISLNEAIRIYNECSHNCKEKSMWNQLRRRLRKKIFMIHLAITYVKSSSLRAATSRPFCNTLTSLHSVPAIANTDRQSQSRDISKQHNVRKYDQPLNEKGRLLTSLQKSKNAQIIVNDKITSTISSILNSNTLPLRNFNGHFQAMMTVKKLQLEKLNMIYLRINIVVSKSAFCHWRKCCQFHKVELICRCFLKHFAAFRMFAVIEMAQIRALYISMEKYKSFACYYQSKEQLAAALEIQRYWRGALARLMIKQHRIHIAAVNIQKVIRRHLVRKIIYARRRFVLMKSSVKSIETVWQRFRWARTLKKLFQLQKRNRQAAKIQALFRGHRGRVRFMRLYIARGKLLGALGFQCLWRRYRASVRVAGLRVQRKRNIASIYIQKFIRGLQARKRFLVRMRIHRSAIVLQYCCICYIARMKVQMARWDRSATRIQRIVRGRAGQRCAANRRAAKHEKERRVALALQTISAVVVGYRTRKVWGPIVSQHVKKRSNATLVIQILLKALLLGLRARRRVAQLRASLALRRSQRLAAVTIQRVVRGYRGRRRFAMALAEYNKKMELANRLPYYYRKRDEYYRTQNLFHRPYVLKIQAAIRRKLAYNKIVRVRGDVNALKIQLMFRRFRACRILKERKIAYMKTSKIRGLIATKIQRIARGFNARYPKRASKSCVVVIWFLKINKMRSFLLLAIQKRRDEKALKIRRYNAAIKIQTPARGKIVRKEFKRSYKRLMRERKARSYQRAVRAATRIQGLFRMRQARKFVEKKKAEREMYRTEQREWETIEQSLAGLHDDFMKELMVLRCQTAGRGMLAKKKFLDKVAEFKKNKDAADAAKRNSAATTIQALARGVLSRKTFKKNLPNLKRALKQRNFCIECEANVAQKRCRQCKDRFCNGCYEKMHSKGARRGHTFEVIRVDAQLLKNLQQQQGTTAGGGRVMSAVGTNKDAGANTVSAIPVKSNKKEWEEFYDSSARAKYWFNKNTGEASWICPY